MWEADDDENENDDAPVSNELTQDKVKWLQEQAFARKKSKDDGNDIIPVSNELTQNKVKWLQEQAFSKSKGNDDDIKRINIQ